MGANSIDFNDRWLVQTGSWLMGLFGVSSTSYAR